MVFLQNRDECSNKYKMDKAVILKTQIDLFQKKKLVFLTKHEITAFYGCVKLAR